MPKNAASIDEMAEQPVAKRARLMSSVSTVLTWRDPRRFSDHEIQVPDCDLLGCNHQSGQGQDKSEHRSVPKAEDSTTTSEKTNPCLSFGPYLESSTGPQRANNHCKDPEILMADTMENAPHILPRQYTIDPTTSAARWTRELSPSISLMHSTAPEINKWAQSPGIKSSLKKQREGANLQRAAPVLAATQQMDDFDFPRSMYPYGAWGVKRPLKNAYLPKRPETKQRSNLYISATPDSFGAES
ncbi:hypothetical protein HDK90DRAFT_465991 [Phyllosticta capitalensis]|uniref:Uncharacterized protein n=1 Tax=Phyllosticta capitalensis TaxID=121624 RepID=A0ABR1YQC7_9PEZI